MNSSGKCRLFLRITATLVLAGAAGAAPAPPRAELTVGGQAKCAIVLAGDASPAEKFAAEELARYIRAISGAQLQTIEPTDARPHRIVFARSESIGKKFGPDAYALAVKGLDVVLVADSDRARLFAVYDLLERLGCRWLAPHFVFYNGAAEFIPKNANLVIELDDDGVIIEEPDFAIRKLDVEEGLSHNTENLRQLVEWAPKLRYNTLMVPRDYGGRGRVTWDQWRDAITPEAKKRGLIIEVGGHGYENFINAKMEDGKLFERHPEWFGQDDKGKRSKSQRRVFCTSNGGAVEFVTNGVLDYLASRPEIEVFEMWPPDGAEWCTCDACKALGEPPDRQALLVNHVQNVLEKERPGVRLEIIAYSKALLPPSKVKLDPRILVDFCPINQCFEVPINDLSSERNADYVKALLAWRKEFTGDIGLYSYYRKYAWKSLPVLIPHYMQADLQFYKKQPLQAVMIYGEPGDWGTYEVNHYTLGKLAWNANADVAELLVDFCKGRYGADHAEAAHTALVMLGGWVRSHGNIPFTRIKSPQQIHAARAKLSEIIAKFPRADPAFVRLHLMFKYAIRDLDIQKLRAAKAPKEEIAKQVESLVAFLAEHKDAGVFIIRGQPSDLDRALSRYGVQPAKPVEPGE
jgi:hypothetical protein